MDRRLENPQVTVISADLALLVANGTTTATFTSGRTVTSRFAVSLIFLRKDGQWKLLHGHYSIPANQT
jgi:ketosteroid isomerase-like protein